MRIRLALVWLSCFVFQEHAAVESRSCPGTCLCSFSEELNETHWVCTNVTSSSAFVESDARNVTSLTLVNSKLVNGSFDGFVFPSLKHLAFKRIFPLKEGAILPFPLLESLNVSNVQFYCDKSLVWLLQWKIRFNSEESSCMNISPFNGTNVIRALKYIDHLQTSCPKGCDCTLDFLPNKGDLLPTVIVNCSSLGLLNFPQLLPQNVSIKLDLRNNQIKNLTMLVTNPAYLQVHSVHLDHNEIRSLAELEGSKWIEQFVLFSLVGNKLTSFPALTFENAFQRNKNGVLMFLSQNPWKCDCTELSSFQTFLTKYPKHVKDVANVRCATPDRGDVGQKIIAVDLNSVCYSADKNSINSMDVVNTCLALLIILTIGKLLYDYYDFRKTGRLPWIISKLP